MNPCIVNLLNDEHKIQHFVQRLPIAFEMVSNEMPPGNPAIGILREHIIIGYFISEFGKDKVSVPTQGNKRGFDVIVCNEKLSIKTVTGFGHGSIKVLWTVDQSKIDQEIERYQPEYDLFLVTIHWGQTRDSIFYIPTSVQLKTYEMFGEEYLNAKRGTNHRGIFIRTEAVKAMKLHSDTLKCKVTWKKQGLYYTPHQRWEDFWKKS
jgi:hypothetical protein